MLDSKLESKIEELTDKYMSDEGKCETVAGEMLRAYNRVVYRYFNDGDVAGEGYGRETVNPALRYLFSQLPSIKHFFEINYYDKSIDFFDYDYETILNKIGFMILDHFEKRPELFTLTNFDDMLNFAVDSDREYDDYDYDDYE